MTVSVHRSPWLTVFLVTSITAWSIGLGAKLFELLVLISAWAADPPTSFSLLPYGPRWAFDPGDFFQPLSALLVIGTVGALLCGWNTQQSYKLWLWVPLVSLIIIWAATPTLFWPMIGELYAISINSSFVSDETARELAARWITLDWCRTALIAVGFGASVVAISSKFRAYGA